MRRERLRAPVRPGRQPAVAAGASLPHLWAALALCLPLGVPVAGAAENTTPSETRVVRIKVVADEAFREKKDWEKEIREHVAWSDERLRELAGIGFEVVSVEPWTTHGSPVMSLLLSELRVGVDKEGAEAVIGFTGHPPPVTMMFLPGGPVRYPLPFTAGIAFPLGDRAVVRRTDWKKLTRHTLIHEFAHLFGGLHVDDKSILETNTDRTSFRLDPFNRRVLALTRDRDFNRGIRDLPPDQLAALVELYHEAPLRRESDPDTAIRIAYLYLMAGEVDEAIGEFRRALELAPAQSRDILRYAIIPELEAWADEHEPTVRSRYMLAQAYFVIERWLDAAAQLVPACTPPAEDAASCALLGAVYLKAGQLGLAESTLATALRLDDSLADAHNTLASVYAAAGRYDAALRSFERALARAPDHVETHFNRGLTCLAADRPADAEASFRTVLRLREDHDPARAKLALALARQGRGKEATRLIKPFGKRRTLSAYILRDMAEVYFLSGDEDEAFKTLQLAKKGGIDVEQVETLIQEGTEQPRRVRVGDLIDQAEAYYRTGKLENARDLLLRAGQEKPEEPRVEYWLGRVAAEERQEEQARAHFRRSLELDSEFYYSQYELGRLAYRDEDFAAAAGLLGEYVEHEEAGANSHYMLGRSHFSLGNQAEAEKHLRAAILKRSDYGNAFYFLGRVFLEQGRDEEARKELQLAVDSRSLPDTRREDAHLRLARLAEAAGDRDDAERHAAVALRLGAAEAADARVRSPRLSTGGIELLEITPSLARVLPRGQEVRIAATVRYDLQAADRGAIFLVVQDEEGGSLGAAQSSAAVERGAGEVTVGTAVVTPAGGAHIEVFLALHAQGQSSTSSVVRVRYVLE